jgi:hypothetical protein
MMLNPRLADCNKIMTMEEQENSIEKLFNKAEEYGKSGLELIKLKALDKSSDVVSSVIPHSVVLIIISSFLLFFNLGLALWLGEIFGKPFYGFFTVAAFYVVFGIVLHFFMHKWIKKIVSNYIINQMLK